MKTKYNKFVVWMLIVCFAAFSAAPAARADDPTPGDCVAEVVQLQAAKVAWIITCFASGPASPVTCTTGGILVAVQYYKTIRKCQAVKRVKKSKN